MQLHYKESNLILSRDLVVFQAETKERVVSLEHFTYHQCRFIFEGVTSQVQVFNVTVVGQDVAQ